MTLVLESAKTSLLTLTNQYKTTYFQLFHHLKDYFVESSQQIHEKKLYKIS